MVPVPDLSNLDVYFDIGVELDLEQAEILDDAHYRALYREKLQRWNDFSPLKPDGRLWTGAEDMVPATVPQRARRRA